MILLTSTSDLIQVVTSTTGVTNVHASYIDYNAGAVTPGRKNTVINTAATTSIVAAPGSGVQRNIKNLTVYCDGAQTVIVQHTDGANVVNLAHVSLGVDEILSYEDGSGWQVTSATGAIRTVLSATGQFISHTRILNGTTSFTTSALTTKIVVKMVGAGGGGGGVSGSASNAACGGGGGAGGYCEAEFAVVPNTAYTCAVGAKGTAGANTGGTGGTGGDTTFTVGATTITAKGGSGGVGQTFGTTAGFVAGGAGGTISLNGEVNGAGAPGEHAYRVSGTSGRSGSGGSSLWGGGGNGLTAAAAGNNGVGYGSGGGGAYSTSAAAIGGTGGDGLILVLEYT